MARYRKFDTRTWLDENFLALSPPQEGCGRYLWFYLIAGPSTTNVPGIYRAGLAQLAEELGWSTEAFAKAFAEATSQGMVSADWKSRVVWVPNAIKYHDPESPNVVTSWRVPWDEIPNCPLKLAAWERLKSFLDIKISMTKGKGKANPKAFLEAFLEACPKPSPKPSPNQEQEQEQEQNRGREALALEDQIQRVDQVVQSVFDAKLGLARPGRSIEDRIRDVLPCPRARVVVAVDALAKADIPNWTYFADCFANPLPQRQRSGRRSTEADLQRAGDEWVNEKSTEDQTNA